MEAYKFRLVGVGHSTDGSSAATLCRSYVVLELARLWNRGRCHPPLDDTEVVRTVNSICLREAQRREADHGSPHHRQSLGDVAA